MKKRIMYLVVILSLLFSFTAFAEDDAQLTKVTIDEQYTASISGTKATVNVPFAVSVTSYRIGYEASAGAVVKIGYVNSKDPFKSTRTISVTGTSGTKKEYTLTVNREKPSEPSIALYDADEIEENAATVGANVTPGEDNVSSINIKYYDKKSNIRTASIRDGYAGLTGLTANTTYYYYAEVKTSTSTYTSSRKSFKTKSSKSSSNSTGIGKDKKDVGYDSNTSPGGTISKEAIKSNEFKNQWNMYNGKWYYYDDKGDAKRGWIQTGEDWFWVDPDYNMYVNQWLKKDNKWYYLRDGGYMVRGWATIDNEKYFMDGSGMMIGGNWLQTDTGWFYFDPTGKMVHDNWVMWNNVWYYMQTDGTMVINADREINGLHYYFTETGAMAINANINGQFYGVNGAAVIKQ